MKPPILPPRPLTASQRQARSRAKRIRAVGAPPMQVIHSPESAAALARLMASGYAATAVETVRRALIDTASRL